MSDWAARRALLAQKSGGAARPSKVQWMQDAPPAPVSLPSSRVGKQRRPLPATRPASSMHSESVASVQSHYNARPERGVQERAQSPIAHLKFFNNWLKSVLIDEFIACTPRATVLDFCCGKGGDLRKWMAARVAFVVGVDVADVSVEQCRLRFRELHSPPFGALFFAEDAFGAALLPRLAAEMRAVARPALFHGVSCQFSLHYAGESEARLLQALRNATTLLAPDGHLVVTTINAVEMLFRLQEALAQRADDEDPGTVSFGSALCTVVFSTRDLVVWRRHSAWRDVLRDLLATPVAALLAECPLGVPYRFQLEDAIDDCAEYLLPMPVVARLADALGLDVVLDQAFPAHYDARRSQAPYTSLLYKMGVLDASTGQPTLTDAEWDIAGLYSAIVLKKRPAAPLAARAAGQ